MSERLIKTILYKANVHSFCIKQMFTTAVWRFLSLVVY